MNRCLLIIHLVYMLMWLFVIISAFSAFALILIAPILIEMVVVDRVSMFSMRVLIGKVVVLIVSIFMVSLLNGIRLKHERVNS